nr:PQQ-dependent sugar dehydrogenase [Chloroflexota bacterium]
WSFDRATTDLWIADVGQERYEEVNRSKASTTSKSRGRGVNYGWRVMEGLHCYRPSSCDKSGKVKPVVEYSHSQGCSIIGGYVYRGSAVPGLAAKYVFGDFCSGKIWTIPHNASKPASKTLLLSTGRNITAFGQDRGGELYVLATNGTLYRIEAP